MRQRGKSEMRHAAPKRLISSVSAVILPPVPAGQGCGNAAPLSDGGDAPKPHAPEQISPRWDKKEGTFIRENPRRRHLIRLCGRGRVRRVCRVVRPR